MNLYGTGGGLKGGREGSPLFFQSYFFNIRLILDIIFLIKLNNTAILFLFFQQEVGMSVTTLPSLTFFIFTGPVAVTDVDVDLIFFPSIATL